MKDFLPIGTVVLLKKCTKKLMIVGYISALSGSSEVYDYSGCMYPEGLIDSSKTYLFNSDQIDKVFYNGYMDEDAINFMSELRKEYLRIKSNKDDIDTLDV